MTQQDARICPRPGHLVMLDASGAVALQSVGIAQWVGLVVAARGIEVQIMIDDELTWIRRDRLEVVHGDSTKSN